MAIKRALLSLLIIANLVSSIFAQVSVSYAAPSPQVGFNAAKALRSTVFIRQLFTTPEGQLITSCIGSGTLVSANGLVLTNAHTALSSDHCRTEKLIVGLTVRIGEAPVATYYAETVAANVGWDLAVLRITNTLDGRPVDIATLNLPFVEMGDSEAVRLDDTINVVGYINSDQQADISQVVRTTVGGFTAEALVGDRAWIKSSASIPGGMSGGGAYGIDGKLVGIPTVEPARNSGEALSCRHIQDSNNDGRVDTQDNCIPISGFINAIRPSRLARGLILAAQLAISPSTKPATQALPALQGDPKFSRLFFATGVNEGGMPTNIVTGLPAGSTRVYLFFDYENLRDGMLYELRTTLDGVPNPTFSLAPATWSGGPRGLWYIGSTAQTWPNGTYDFSLFIEGIRVASKQITIGGPARQDPAFSDILFGILDPDGKLASTGNVLPVGDTINAAFFYNNIPPNMSWRQVWYYEGLKISETTDTWKEGSNGRLPINATGGAGLLTPGRYRLELYLNDSLAATSDFIMAGAQTALKSEVFNALSFATEIKDGQPAGVIGTTFSGTIQTLYATFGWREMAVGIPFTWRWKVDENPLFEVTQQWGDTAEGTNNWLKLETKGRIPDGSYKVELVIAGTVVGTATAKVGLGQLPVSLFGGAEGVQMQGRITDAETGKGIAGVAFIVIKVDFDTRSFEWKGSQVYDLSYTDEDGNFTLSRLLVPETEKTYSIIIIAEGYLPINADGIGIDTDTKSPIIYNVALSRD
jgi:hypothetical protein